jgi:hypothetical protein
MCGPFPPVHGQRSELCAVQISEVSLLSHTPQNGFRVDKFGQSSKEYIHEWEETTNLGKQINDVERLPLVDPPVIRNEEIGPKDDLPMDVLDGETPV